MNSLVIAEHDNTELKPSTLNTVTAAGDLDFPIDIMVIGNDCGSVAQEAARYQISVTCWWWIKQSVSTSWRKKLHLPLGCLLPITAIYSALPLHLAKT